MMPGPSSALCRCACGYHLKQEPKVFSVPISQFPVTVPTGRTKQEDHQQGSLEYVVGRLSPSATFVIVHVETEARQLLYGRVGTWTQAVWYSLHPWLLFGLCFCVVVRLSPFLLSTSNQCSSEFCLFSTYFPLVSLEHLSSGHRWFCSQPLGMFQLLFLLDSPWPLIPRCV